MSTRQSDDANFLAFGRVCHEAAKLPKLPHIARQGQFQIRRPGTPNPKRKRGLSVRVSLALRVSCGRSAVDFARSPLLLTHFQGLDRLRNPSAEGSQIRAEAVQQGDSRLTQARMRAYEVPIVLGRKGIRTRGQRLERIVAGVFFPSAVEVPPLLPQVFGVVVCDGRQAIDPARAPGPSPSSHGAVAGTRKRDDFRGRAGGNSGVNASAPQPGRVTSR